MSHFDRTNSVHPLSLTIYPLKGCLLFSLSLPLFAGGSSSASRFKITLDNGGQGQSGFDFGFGLLNKKLKPVLLGCLLGGNYIRN